MHTLVSFLGCMGTLMKASCVDILISAAFACIDSIVNGKAWTNGLWAYRLILAVLLYNFYPHGAKTYEVLIVYLETAREHPTGRLWVDCFVKPTLLSLMFLRGERNGDFLLQQHCPRPCCHTSSQQVTTIMPTTRVGMCDRWSTFPSVPRRSYWQVRIAVGTRMGDRSVSGSVRGADIYQATEGFWRYEGHFKLPRTCGWANE